MNIQALLSEKVSQALIAQARLPIANPRSASQQKFSSATIRPTA
ncbi:Arginyl-tRNA synthetase [Klebsiella pneumoniae IS33]|nr:Arginyl-tRNA synthetase [Klebsiella pneumoniae IS33]